MAGEHLQLEQAAFITKGLLTDLQHNAETNPDIPASIPPLLDTIVFALDDTAGIYSDLKSPADRIESVYTDARQNDELTGPEKTVFEVALGLADLAEDICLEPGSSTDRLRPFLERDTASPDISLVFNLTGASDLLHVRTDPISNAFIARTRSAGGLQIEQYIDTQVLPVSQKTGTRVELSFVNPATNVTQLPRSNRRPPKAA